MILIIIFRLITIMTGFILPPGIYITQLGVISSRLFQSLKEAIMADINELVEDFWRTSSHGADGKSYFAMRRLLEILQERVFSFF